ncbi:hypothetical protein MPSEU_001020000 [Mayamaea pseudoterrestris]|nr:hypothetical protein MPSEU_001020000 [Mayamaea pseudoterrestris]
MLRSIQKPITTAGRRFMATNVRNPLLPKVYQDQTFKEAFLSDPATYPLIVVLTAAGCFIVGMSFNALYNYQDIRILPSHKHEVIPTWIDKPRVTVTEVLGKNPHGFHADAMKAIRYEGLGVDHDNWDKKHSS